MRNIKINDSISKLINLILLLKCLQIKLSYRSIVKWRIQLKIYHSKSSHHLKIVLKLTLFTAPTNIYFSTSIPDKIVLLIYNLKITYTLFVSKLMQNLIIALINKNLHRSHSYRRTVNQLSNRLLYNLFITNTIQQTISTKKVNRTITPCTPNVTSLVHSHPRHVLTMPNTQSSMFSVLAIENDQLSMLTPTKNVSF